MPKPATTFERRQAILQFLQDYNSVRVTQLADWLHVSEGTIRNDLEALDEAGQLRRVRGGAVPLHVGPNPAQKIREKARVQADEKGRIAQWAAGMIENGDVILMDASTTVMYMADYLTDRRNLTIFTNGIEVARLLAQHPSNTVILLGGLLRADGNAVVGTLSEHILKGFHIRTAFVSCKGFLPGTGFMEGDLEEAQMKAHMLQTAQRRIALVDSSKIDLPGLTPFASIEDMDYVVTDVNAPYAVIETIRRAKTNAVVCGEKTVSTFASYDETSPHYKIGFANISEALPFGRDVRRGLEEAVQATNQVELIVTDNQLDPDIALAVADDLIAAGVDLAVEFQIDETMGNRIAHKFQQAGIPVIAVDIPMVGATFFGVDNYKAGYIAGRALGQAVQDAWGGDYDRLIVLEHPRAGYLPAMRIQGQLEALEEVIGPVPPDQIIYVDSGNTFEVSYQAMLHELAGLPEGLRLPIICFNDDAALGAMEAARALDRAAEVLIVGQGADRRLRDELRAPGSRVIGSTAFQPERYGGQLLALALKILAGEQVPPAVYMQHTFINAANIETHYPSQQAEAGD